MFRVQYEPDLQGRPLTVNLIHVHSGPLGNDGTVTNTRTGIDQRNRGENKCNRSIDRNNNVPPSVGGNLAAGEPPPKQRASSKSHANNTNFRSRVKSRFGFRSLISTSLSSHEPWLQNDGGTVSRETYVYTLAYIYIYLVLKTRNPAVRRLYKICTYK